MSTEISQDLQLSAYDYELPSDLIAQIPTSPRDHSRLLVVRSPFFHRQRSQLQSQLPSQPQSQPPTDPPPTLNHQHFFDLPQWLNPGDLLVLNNTRVIPARLHGRKVRSSYRNSVAPSPQSSPPEEEADLETALNSATVEVFLLEELAFNRWLTLVRPGRKLRPGNTIQFGPTSTGIVVQGHIREMDEATGGRIVEFEVFDPALTKTSSSDGPQMSLWEVLPDLGEVPLPPYISNPDVETERYQTVYSDQPGAVAAPTAGLHFTPELLEKLQQMGVNHVFVTLHVGVGTFRPVEAENITNHQMHGEWINVPEETVAQIQVTKRQGRRVIAVGTTVTRSLEAAAQFGTLQPFQGKTNLFIYPGYQWQVIDALITNFHLPKSSLMMMVSALMGREALLYAYQDAIAHQYRFYSLGDAMLILPQD
ncbi:MAG: tRNA preQ1(34) S-adenosylmethionine ribosyltransferase-isomerase QueA [Cyanothece sp. SIO2G6]|nr:tRNA preQ1(34) S-adenosylmethionine ribosyltransferase-isomerase QueA [Cyanothece sp. SIO2G6]